MDKLEITYMKTNDITPYAGNPRKNDKAVEMVAKSIKEFGFKNPIILDENNIIVAGHTRLLASQKLGLEEVPTIQIKDLTEKQIKAYRIADNKTNEFAEWDMELLEIELGDLGDIFTGFDDEELNEIMNIDKEIVEDDFEVELPEEPKSKLGDIYQLGRHRLVCADSTSESDVNVLMNGNKADMVLTDPPYGMKKENEGVLNDNLNYNALLEFNKKWIPLTFQHTKENGSWYCWGTDEPLMDIYSEILKPMIKNQQATFRNLITWDKGYGQGQLAEEFRMYPIADEKCLFVMKGVQGFNTNADNYYNEWEPIRKYLKDELKLMGWSIGDSKRIAGHSETSGCHWFDKSQWTMPTEEVYKAWQKEAKGDGFKKEYDKLKKEYYSTRSYFDNTHDNMNNVWDMKRTSQQEKENTGEHATVKPIALCERGIKSSSREYEIVMDLFGGSGSTLIACEQLDRICYMMELDPKYCDVIIKRWEKLTGQTAKLIKE